MLLKKTLVAFGTAGLVLLGGGPAGAQAATTATTPSSTSNPQGDRLTARYSGFAGSQANAQSLVSGLRTGSSITLAPSATGPNAGAPAASFSPASGKMGYGNINIALSLAKASLAREGITNPTPAQLAAALNGGKITTASGTVTLAGVLSQRAEGMGWGKIAKGMGVTLGSLVSASHPEKGDKDDRSARKSEHSGKTESMARADHAGQGLASSNDAGSHGKGGNASSGNGGGGGGNGGGGNGGGNGGGHK
ncbi:hypothetical protein [Polaromonas sp.]|uniref:hypothetical protein n=1 Tax=Polaromonas sp. TaxID=1869339 RepID=UPI00286B1E2D|nr:hypothetical protein [Polaromonas sp.]